MSKVARPTRRITPVIVSNELQKSTNIAEEVLSQQKEVKFVYTPVKDTVIREPATEGNRLSSLVLF
jgi:hypothetical protein